jgi:hypothetical protein
VRIVDVEYGCSETLKFLCRFVWNVNQAAIRKIYNTTVVSVSRATWNICIYGGVLTCCWLLRRIAVAFRDSAMVLISQVLYEVAK